MDFEEDFTDEILEEEEETAVEDMLVSEETAGDDAEDQAEGEEQEDESDGDEDSWEDDSAEDSSDDESEDGKERKSLFGKKVKKEKKDKKELQIEELTDRVKRSMAEFDNFRKRTEKEKAAMYDMGAKSVIEKMLPVIDNFERGLAALPKEQQPDAFADGMDRIYKQMLKTLEDMGVQQIPAVGEVFDLNLHNAVMHIEDDSVGENIIVQELQKGYTYKGIVVRHSMVQVAN